MDAKEFNAVAWRDFVMFAWGQPDAHKAFRGHMGWPQMRGDGRGLNAMIDRACGVPAVEDPSYMEQFIDWVTKAHWGQDMDPRTPAPADTGGGQ